MHTYIRTYIRIYWQEETVEQPDTLVTKSGNVRPNVPTIHDAKFSDFDQTGFDHSPASRHIYPANIGGLHHDFHAQNASTCSPHVSSHSVGDQRKDLSAHRSSLRADLQAVPNTQYGRNLPRDNEGFGAYHSPRDSHVLTASRDLSLGAKYPPSEHQDFSNVFEPESGDRRVKRREEPGQWQSRDVSTDMQHAQKRGKFMNQQQQPHAHRGYGDEEDDDDTEVNVHQNQYSHRENKTQKQKQRRENVAERAGGGQQQQQQQQPHKSVFALLALPEEEMISFSEEVWSMCVRVCAYINAIEAHSHTSLCTKPLQIILCFVSVIKNNILLYLPRKR